MRFRFLYISSLVLTVMLLAASCSSTSPSPSDGELAATAAMQTLTAMGIFTTPDPIQPIVSNTPLPTESEATPSPSPTRTPLLRTPTPTEDPQACTDQVSYGSDIDLTYPDGTEVFPNATIEKIWRIRNDGTCTWSPAYKLVFSHGDQMAGPSIQALPGTVDPGATVDISIELTVPATPGTYQGFWKLRNDEGAYLKGPTGNDLRLWVEIVIPEAPPGVVRRIFNLIGSYSGNVKSDSSTDALTNVGDTPSGASVQAFMTWDISSIPAGSTIDDVEIHFSDYDVMGLPFTELNCLRAYAQDYGTLDSTDFVSGSASGAIETWCSADALETASVSSDFKTALQNKVGSTYFQIRLQFNEVATDGDSASDLVRFRQPRLYVTYSEP